MKPPEKSEKKDLENSTPKSDHRKCKKIWLILFVVTLHVVFFVVSGYGIYLTLTGKLEDRFEELSESRNQSIEKRLLRSINFSVNPCTNFYEFICGNWIQQDTIPDNFIRTSTSIELENKILRKIENYLNSTNSEYEPKAIHEARKMYTSCVSSRFVSASETPKKSAEYEKLASLLHRLRLPVVPNFSKISEQFSWMLPAIMIKKSLNQDFLFQFSIQPDPYITKANRIYITNPSNKFHARFDQDHDINAKSKSGFYKFIRSIAIYMYEQNDKKWTISTRLEFRRRFCNFFTFARQLEQLDFLNNGSYLADYMSIQDLQQMTELIFKNKNPSSISKINWKSYLEKLFQGSSISLNLNYNDRLILIPSKQYISEVLKLLAKTPSHILEFYMWSKTLFEILPYSKSILTDRYDNYLNNFFGKQRPQRNLYCTDLVHREFHFATSYFIIRDADMKKKILEVQSIFKNIREVFYEEMKNTSWLDKQTKTKALKKLESMKINVGYPDWINDFTKIDKYYNNLTMDENDLLQNVLNIRARQFYKMLSLYKIENDHEKENPWIGHILEVNAFYSSFYNRITIPAGLLAYPFYDLGIQAMNYGAIGVIIGHEIIHGFDNSGKEFDADGHLNSWWSYHTKLEYERRANIFIDNYDQFVINYMKRNNVDDMQLYLNGLATLNENIADHGGLRMALKAYKNYIKIHGAEKFVTNLNFTPEQAFFASFTHSRCEHINDQMRQLRLTDEHGLNMLRVLTTLSSSKEFSEAWKCEVGSPMNPSEEKCRLLW